MKAFVNCHIKYLFPLCIQFLLLCTCEKPEQQQIVIETGSIIDTSSTSVTVTGNIINLGEGIATYGHMAATDNAFTENVKKSSLFNPSNIGTYTSTIADLMPYTFYYVRAYATSSQETVYGSQISFTTLLEKTFTDNRDGHVYNLVKIGDQVWMAENLAYLPAVSPPSSGSTTSPYYYVYGYEGTSVITAKATSNYSTYGVLYNWPAAMAGAASSSSNPSGVQGVCPIGWHLPSDAEWTELTDYLGGEDVAGGKLKEIGYDHWRSPNTDATDEKGFTALPSGCRHNNGSFAVDRNYGFWWSAVESDVTYAWSRYVCYNCAYVFRGNHPKDFGLSVRCVRD